MYELREIGLAAVTGEIQMNDALYEGLVEIKMGGTKQVVAKKVRASSSHEARGILESMYGKVMGAPRWAGK